MAENKDKKMKKSLGGVGVSLPDIKPLSISAGTAPDNTAVPTPVIIPRTFEDSNQPVLQWLPSNILPQPDFNPRFDELQETSLTLPDTTIKGESVIKPGWGSEQAGGVLLNDILQSTIDTSQESSSIDVSTERGKYKKLVQSSLTLPQILLNTTLTALQEFAAQNSLQGISLETYKKVQGLLAHGLSELSKNPSANVLHETLSDICSVLSLPYQETIGKWLSEDLKRREEFLSTSTGGAWYEAPLKRLTEEGEKAMSSSLFRKIVTSGNTLKDKIHGFLTPDNVETVKERTEDGVTVKIRAKNPLTQTLNYGSFSGKAGDMAASFLSGIKQGKFSPLTPPLVALDMAAGGLLHASSLGSRIIGTYAAPFVHGVAPHLAYSPEELKDYDERFPSPIKWKNASFPVQLLSDVAFGLAEGGVVKGVKASGDIVSRAIKDVFEDTAKKGALKEASERTLAEETSLKTSWVNFLSHLPFSQKKFSTSQLKDIEGVPLDVGSKVPGYDPYAPFTSNFDLAPSIYTWSLRALSGTTRKWSSFMGESSKIPFFQSIKASPILNEISNGLQKFSDNITKLVPPSAPYGKSSYTAFALSVKDKVNQLASTHWIVTKSQKWMESRKALQEISTSYPEASITTQDLLMASVRANSSMNAMSTVPRQIRQVTKKYGRKELAEIKASIKKSELDQKMEQARLDLQKARDILNLRLQSVESRYTQALESSASRAAKAVSKAKRSSESIVASYTEIKDIISSTFADIFALLDSLSSGKKQIITKEQADALADLITSGYDYGAVLKGEASTILEEGATSGLSDFSSRLSAILGIPETPSSVGETPKELLDLQSKLYQAHRHLSKAISRVLSLGAQGIRNAEVIEKGGFHYFDAADAAKRQMEAVQKRAAITSSDMVRKEANTLSYIEKGKKKVDELVQAALGEYKASAESLLQTISRDESVPGDTYAAVKAILKEAEIDENFKNLSLDKVQELLGVLRSKISKAELDNPVPSTFEHAFYKQLLHLRNSAIEAIKDEEAKKNLKKVLNEAHNVSEAIHTIKDYLELTKYAPTDAESKRAFNKIMQNLGMTLGKDYNSPEFFHFLAMLHAVDFLEEPLQNFGRDFMYYRRIVKLGSGGFADVSGISGKGTPFMSSHASDALPLPTRGTGLAPHLREKGIVGSGVEVLKKMGKTLPVMVTTTGLLTHLGYDPAYATTVALYTSLNYGTPHLDRFLSLFRKSGRDFLIIKENEELVRKLLRTIVESPMVLWGKTDTKTMLKWKGAMSSIRAFVNHYVDGLDEPMTDDERELLTATYIADLFNQELSKLPLEDDNFSEKISNLLFYKNPKEIWELHGVPAYNAIQRALGNPTETPPPQISDPTPRVEELNKLVFEGIDAYEELPVESIEDSIVSSLLKYEGSTPDFLSAKGQGGVSVGGWTAATVSALKKKYNLQEVPDLSPENYEVFSYWVNNPKNYLMLLGAYLQDFNKGKRPYTLKDLKSLDSGVREAVANFAISLGPNKAEETIREIFDEVFEGEINSLYLGALTSLAELLNPYSNTWEYISKKFPKSRIKELQEEVLIKLVSAWTASKIPSESAYPNSKKMAQTVFDRAYTLFSAPLLGESPGLSNDIPDSEKTFEETMFGEEDITPSSPNTPAPETELPPLEEVQEPLPDELDDIP